jgi:hypothetical protein
LTTHDQPGSFEHLDVLGDGREGHRERLGQFVDGRRALGEPGQDGPARPIGQCGEGLAQLVFVKHDRHGPLVSILVNKLEWKVQADAHRVKGLTDFLHFSILSTQQDLN